MLARDEENQATTQESMFNYVRLSDGLPDGDLPRYEGPRSEVDSIASIAERALQDREDLRQLPINWRDLRDHAHCRDLCGQKTHVAGRRC